MSLRPWSNVRVDYFRVPGACEIPLKCKQLLSSGDYVLAVGAGLVVDGGIYRHEFVAQTVVNALMQVQLELGLPVLSVVLTPKEEWHDEHHAFFFDHFKIKCAEAAGVVSELLEQSQVTSTKSQGKTR
jgi:6,7-dimethyl-8-ribityllumazine synthase